MPFNSNFIKLTKFVVLAVARTVLDILIWQVLVSILPEKLISKSHSVLKLNRYGLAHSIAFIISIIISYYTNMWLVFEQTDNENTVAGIFKFTVVSLIAFFASTLLMNFTTENPKILENVQKMPKIIKEHWPLLMKIFTTLVTLVINYGGYSLFVFN